MPAELAIYIEHHLTLMIMAVALVCCKLGMLAIKDKARSVYELTIKLGGK